MLIQRARHLWERGVLHFLSGLFIFPMVFLALFSCVIVSSPDAFASDDGDDELEANISIQIQWDQPNKGDHSLSEKGTASATVTGKIKRVLKEKEASMYSPSGLTVSYNLDNQKFEEESGHCQGMYGEEKGSGSKTVVGWDQAGIDDANFIFEVFWGETARISCSQAGDASCIEEKPSEGAYFFIFYVPVPTEEKYRQGCGTDRKNQKIIGFELFTRQTCGGNLVGSYTWNADPDPQRGVEELFPKAGGCCGATLYDPPEGPKIISYQVQWQFGKVKPVVLIYRNGKNITDDPKIKKNRDVLVGEKIKLEAKVCSTGGGEPNGKWEIPGKIIKDWEASSQEAKVKNFEDYDKSSIEFVWVDGSFNGTSSVVKYTADTDEGQVEGKATYKVYKPKAKTTVKPAKKVNIALYTLAGDENEAENEAEAEIYEELGDAVEACGLLLGPPGITISTNLQMPRGKFKTVGPQVEYVQKVKSNSWLLARSTPSVLDWKKDADDKMCLDGDYPTYPVNQYSIKDNPGQDFTEPVDRVFISMDLETYLMFLPCAQGEEGKCVWVPLKKIPWDWKGSAWRKHAELDPKCKQSEGECIRQDLEGPICNQPPKNAKAEDCSEHPEWDCDKPKNKFSWKFSGHAVMEKDPRDWKPPAYSGTCSW